jgi:RHS repeat-associated protein
MQLLSVSRPIKEPGYVYIYLSNEGSVQQDVFFDDFKVEVVKSPIVQADDYYPFGLTFNSYQRENSEPNRWKFQGQEHLDDLGLNWDSFKWRNHQPDIGRFFNIDPLADKYVYNSPYAFSENKVISHVELEGLEALGYLEKEFTKAQAVRNIPNRIEEGLKDAGKKIVEVGKTAGENLYSLVGWVHNEPKESSDKQQVGDGVHIVDDSGNGGSDQQYVPRADPKGDNSTMEKSFLDGLMQSAKPDVPSTPGNIGERIQNVAEGTDKTANAVQNMNNRDQGSSLKDSVFFTGQTNYNLDDGWVYKEQVNKGDTSWIRIRKIDK